MQKITPHLWFDKEAVQAAEFYVSTFGEGSKIINRSVIRNTPSGDCDIVSFDLFGYSFMAISAGPLFKFTPAVSFHVKCRTAEEVDAIWEKLSNGGKVLMELGEYPFSKRYGWTEDKYGLSWQVICVGDADMTRRITPVMMYTGSVAGKAEEAVRLYTSVCSDGPAAPKAKASEVGSVTRYGKGEEPDKEGTVKYVPFTLLGQEFGAMDSARKHDFTFNEAISFMVHCDTQEEIDYYWSKLSAVPESEQCGWLKDKYGLSWQVVPTAMDEMMQNSSEEQMARVTEAFLNMKKFDIIELQRAYEEKEMR